MEDLVESYLKKARVEYYKEMCLTEIENKWSIDLSAISAEGTSTKRWDFVVKSPSCVYVIETNFYTSGGSKLNETARSYRMIAEEAKAVPGFKFVWITDGGGWTSARRNLEETFNVLDDLYNIADMESNVFTTLFKLLEKGCISLFERKYYGSNNSLLFNLTVITVVNLRGLAASRQGKAVKRIWL